MSDAPLTPYNPGSYDDEISISELLLKLWAKRGLIVFLPFIFAGLTVVGLLIAKTGQQTSVSLYIELNAISLASAVKSADADADADADDAITTRYPNGVVFSPQDLMNPSVIGLLSEEADLNSEDLAEHIDVQFGTPVSNGVLKEYGVALSSKSKASSEELAALNERYKRKLDAAAKRGLKITVDFVELGISRDEGKQLAESLPKLWNKIYTQQFRTLLPSEIMGLRWTQDIHDLTSTIGLQEADIQIEALTQGVDAIVADERLIGLKNRDGVTASDIRTYISRFRAIYFEPLFLAAFETDASLTKVYERDIGVETRRIEAEINELNARLESLQGSRARTQTSSSASRQDFGASLDGGALSQVVSLAEQASGSRYIQATLEKRFELVEEKAVLQARLERMMPSSDARVDITANFVEMATSRYQTIVGGYSDLLMRAKEAAVTATPSYYSITTQPESEGSLIGTRDLLFIALALALGGMVAVLSALVWPQSRPT
jgi:hypothetical protein